MSATAEQIAAFRGGSKTYYNASRFFPEAVKDQVIRFYAFVRIADNLVDATPQQTVEFNQLCQALAEARTGTASGWFIVDDFAQLEQSAGFERAWTDAFLASMRMDLEKSEYATIDETLAYIYGSAEVIGLFMAHIMGLSTRAAHAARMQGRAMQMINFIRDIAEDCRLGRTYLPQAETSLPALDETHARSDPGEFKRYIQAQIDRYFEWQSEAQAGYQFSPRAYLIPIKTASDMYAWTARQIRRDPFIVFRRKVKPSKARILMTIFGNWLFVHPRETVL